MAIVLVHLLSKSISKVLLGVIKWRQCCFFFFFLFSGYHLKVFCSLNYHAGINFVSLICYGLFLSYASCSFGIISWIIFWNRFYVQIIVLCVVSCLNSVALAEEFLLKKIESFNCSKHLESRNKQLSFSGNGLMLTILCESCVSIDNKTWDHVRKKKLLKLWRDYHNYHMKI